MRTTTHPDLTSPSKTSETYSLWPHIDDQLTTVTLLIWQISMQHCTVNDMQWSSTPLPITEYGFPPCFLFICYWKHENYTKPQGFNCPREVLWLNLTEIKILFFIFHSGIDIAYQEVIRVMCVIRSFSHETMSSVREGGWGRGVSRILELTGGTGRVRTMGAGEVRGREIVSERRICKPPERLCKQLSLR